VKAVDTPVSYARNTDAEGRFREQIHNVIEGGAKRICDVGGGAKPIVPMTQIEQRGLDYVVLDEAAEQLQRTPEGYRRVHASILDRDAIARIVREEGPFDAVISRWTAEHISDGKAFHERVFELIRPGGTAVHLFPTLYSFPFVVNRLLTPTIATAVLFRVCSGRHARFRPYYSWCRGPSPKQLRRLTELGYTIESYTGFFGHGFYRPVRPLHAAHRRVVDRLIEHPRPSLTSFALVVLGHPG
jgi:hypothetical protein